MLVAIATTSMVALAFAVPLAMLVRTLAIERTLGDAEVGARALAPALAGIDAPERLVAAVELTAATVPGALTVVLPDGTMLGVPIEPDAEVAAAAAGQATTVATEDGWRVVVPVVRADGTAVVQVTIPAATAQAGVPRAWVVLALLAAALVVGAVVVADRLGRSTVAAVRDLEEVAQRLGAGDLDARAEVDEPPEVVAVAAALHGLASRIRRLLAAEREAAADLSHRARTPLMALRLDVEALPPSPQTDRLANDVDALERAVDAVIRDARRSTEDRPVAAVDLVAVARERATFWAVLAEDQERHFDVDLPVDPVVTVGRAEDYASAIDSLLGNVFAHTVEGTQFALRVVATVEVGRAAIVIEDAGPDLPAALTPARGVSGGGSTGLGLDIARRTAETAGGELRLERSRWGGARIVMDVPLAPDTPRRRLRRP